MPIVHNTLNAAWLKTKVAAETLGVISHREMKNHLAQWYSTKMIPLDRDAMVCESGLMGEQESYDLALSLLQDNVKDVATLSWGGKDDDTLWVLVTLLTWKNSQVK